MTRLLWILFGLGVILLTVLLPLVPILFWAGLAVAAWYIKLIPERRLPYAAFFATHQPTFYNWLSGFLASWQSTPMFAFIALVVLGVAAWGVLSLGLVSLPTYGASVEIRNSNGGWIGGLSTAGNASDCIDNLADGQYTISEINTAGWISSTPDVVTATLKSGSVALVEFGDTNLTASTQMISRTLVSTQILSNTQKPVLGSICALVWYDLNANGIRDLGEPLLSSPPPIWLSLDFLVHIVGLLFLFLNAIAFLQAKYMAWDVKLWQAEPTARALVGAEFDNLPEAEKTQLYRHLAEVSMGMNKGTWIVREGKYEVKNAPAETFAKFGGPGVLIVQEGHVVILERGGRISRIVGAGRHQLGPFERVNMVVYLPVRVETVSIKDALTRDKMVLKEFVLLVFHRVDRGDRSESSGQYDYDLKIIREKVWSPRSNDWRGTVQSITDSAVRDVIGHYNFEDIISISGDARLRLIQEFTTRINATTQGLLGIEVPGTNIGAITISDEAKHALEAKALSEVARQTALVNAEAEKEIMARKGEGQAIAIRRLEQEKSAIRTELLKQVMDPFKALPPGVLADKEIANKIIDVVERLLERLESNMIRDDLDLLRYSEMLEKLKQVDGPKTVILGDTKGLNTSMDLGPK